MPDDSTAAEPSRPTQETFDEAFADVSASPSVNALFDQALGPFPPHVEPYSLVTREGLERVFAELRLEPDDHLVDLACGRGGIGLWFARESGARLTGIDFSPIAIAEADRRADLFVADGQASFVVADARETSLERQSADAVVCIDALQLLPDGEAVLREAGSLLRGDGRIVLTTWEFDETPPGRTPMPDVGRAAEAAGLHVDLREEHPEWLERQQTVYENAIAADSEDAEPAVRSLADEGRSFLPRIANSRRVLLVAQAGRATDGGNKVATETVLGWHDVGYPAERVPDDSTAVEPSRSTPEMFDEFLRISAARSLVALFDEALGPFPPHVEPFSHVTREGLERVFAELRLEPDDHLVDLCCGRGGIGLWFARESGARLTGIDFSSFAVAEAERRAGLFVAEGQASFVVADMTETSLERQSADAVVCIDSLQHAADGEAALREAGSLLRGDGRIVLTAWELDETPPGRTPVTDLARLAEAAGLQVVLREEHPEWLEGQQALYENVIAADSEDAEQAIRWTADEARSFLPRIADARRVLLVAARRRS